MSAAQRDGLADAALALASAVQAGDAAKVGVAYASNIPADDAANAYLVRSTSARIMGQSLRVTQLYLLDASAHKDVSTSAEFACPLANSTSEADFSINGLPAGHYGFAIVEASGSGTAAQPYVLALLLEQQAGSWKLAGISGHTRAAAGHDGLYYWTTARTRAAAKQPWAAYLLYSEALSLLQPVNYLVSTHLEKLTAEQHTAAPPELANGISADTPYVLASKTKPPAEFRFTDISTTGSDDGQRLLLTLHMQADSTADGPAARARNLAAATAFVDAHPEVRSVVAGVTVFADVQGQPPFATQHTITEIP